MAAFEGGAVWLDQADGAAGTTYPKGTDEDPSSNLTDGRSIAVANKRKIFHFVGGGAAYTLAAGFNGYVFRNMGTDQVAIAINGQSLTAATFRRCGISGANTAGSSFSTEDCVIDLITGTVGLGGYHYRSNFGVTSPTTTKLATCQFIDCKASIAAFPARFDVSGSPGAIDVVADRWSGNATFLNANDAGTIVQWNMCAGEITVDSSCTAGTFVFTGIGRVINNGGASVTVNTRGLLDPGRLQILQHDNLVLDNYTYDPVTGKVSGVRSRGFGTAAATTAATTGAAADADGELVRETMDVTFANGRASRVNFTRGR